MLKIVDYIFEPSLSYYCDVDLLLIDEVDDFLKFTLSAREGVDGCTCDLNLFIGNLHCYLLKRR